MNALHFGAALSSCLSLVFLLLGLSTDYWIADSRIHWGLWKACNYHECVPLGVEWWLVFIHAVQAFMFLGMIAGVVSLGGLCLMKWKPFLGNIPMSKIAFYASFTAAICTLNAMAVFTGRTSTTYYGWSFGLGWGSFAFYLLTGCLTYVLQRSTASTA